MAVDRKAALTNVDSGGYFYLSIQDRGNSTNYLPNASRYTNLNTIINVLDEKYWSINQFGDQQHTLADQRYGYKISDRLWALPEVSLNDSDYGYPNTPGDYEGNLQQRRAVMYSVGQGQYLWIDPSTLGFPPEDMVFAWTYNPYQATRFSNLNDFVTIMEGTTLGSALYGWLAEEYIFTKQTIEFVPEPNAAFHVPVNTSSPTIQRRYVAYSSTLGRYLYIENPEAPIVDMVISFSNSHMQATRFTDVNDIKDIIDGTAIFNTRFKQGWDLLQFLFTAPVDPLTPSPYDEWVGGVSSELVILDPGDGTAPYKSTQEFVEDKVAQREYDPALDDPKAASGLERFINYMTPYLNVARSYKDQQAAESFLGRVDPRDLTEYLTDLYNSYWIG